MKQLSGPRRASWRVAIVAGTVAAGAYVLLAQSQPDATESVQQARTPTAGLAGSSERFGFARRNVGANALNLFASHSWYIAPPAPPADPQPVAAAPMAPPLPYSYLGSYTQAGDTTTYFLVKDDRVYDVHVGDSLDNLYSVDAVTDSQLELTYLPLKIKQQLQVGGLP